MEAMETKREGEEFAETLDMVIESEVVAVIVIAVSGEGFSMLVAG